VKLKIYAAREEDAHQGWVWMQRPELAPRGVICVLNPANDAKIHCEALQIERNFLDSYNQPPRLTISDPASALVIGEWFRAKLGIKTQEEIQLQIRPCRTWYGQFKACTDHPQVVIRVAAWLGVVGLILGVIGLALGIISLR
jgi:hypothetical protein